MESTYNFIESLSRVESRLNTEMHRDYLPSIPPDNECGNQCSHFVYGVVVAVRYNISKDIHEMKAVKILECFVSEVCEIFRSNRSVKDVIVGDSIITAIYSTPMKSDINDLLDDLAMINSIGAVVSKKARLVNKQLEVKIGACYEKLSMSIIGTQKYLWRGDAVDKAHILSDKAQNGSILINKIIWNNLTDANQKLFELNKYYQEVYEGYIRNIVMNNYCNE